MQQNIMVKGSFLRHQKSNPIICHLNSLGSFHNHPLSQFPDLFKNMETRQKIQSFHRGMVRIHQFTFIKYLKKFWYLINVPYFFNIVKKWSWPHKLKCAKSPLPPNILLLILLKLKKKKILLSLIPNRMVHRYFQEIIWPQSVLFQFAYQLLKLIKCTGIKSWKDNDLVSLLSFFPLSSILPIILSSP